MSDRSLSPVTCGLWLVGPSGQPPAAVLGPTRHAPQATSEMVFS